MTRGTPITTTPRGQCRCRRLAVTRLSMCAACREQYPSDNSHAIAPPEPAENGRSRP
jgi:hypothetical protein